MLTLFVLFVIGFYGGLLCWVAIGACLMWAVALRDSIRIWSAQTAKSPCKDWVMYS